MTTTAGFGSSVDAPESGRRDWTGAVYSLLRFVVALLGGLALFWRSSEALAGGIGSAIALGVWIALGLVAVGFQARWAALGVCAVGAVSEWTHSGPTSLAAWAVVGLFGLMALVPQAPYGSLAARGRTDPAGGWRMPRSVTALAWVLQLGLLLPIGAGAFGSSWAPLAWIPFGLLAAAALPPRTRPFAWLLALVLHGVATSLDPQPIVRIAASIGLLGLTFQPRWIPRRDGEGVEQVFYDGACGLCHGAVRFLLAEDSQGVLRFAPIGGETFRHAVPQDLHGRLPDSILVLTERGELLDRSRAVIHALARLGGWWHVVAFFGEALPLALRDPLYDFIAKRRHRWFATPDEACPLLPPHLVERFGP